jgi:hypothetical protein
MGPGKDPMTKGRRPNVTKCNRWNVRSPRRRVVRMRAGARLLTVKPRRRPTYIHVRREPGEPVNTCALEIMRACAAPNIAATTYAPGEPMEARGPLGPIRHSGPQPLFTYLRADIGSPPIRVRAALACIGRSFKRDFKRPSE